MTPSQLIRQNYEQTNNIELAVLSVIPNADAKVIRYWDRVINNPTPRKQQPATRLERGHIGKSRKGVPERVLWKQNALES